MLSAAKLLDRLEGAMLQELRDGSWVQADDTGMPVQDGTDGKLRSARLWTYANGDHAVFRVTRTKEKEGPAAHLAGFKGRLLLDGGSEFNLIEGSAGVVRAGCWSHARRYFFEARKESPIRAGEALILIRELFMLERTIATADIETRRQFRHEKSRLVLHPYCIVSKPGFRSECYTRARHPAIQRALARRSVTRSISGIV